MQALSYLRVAAGDWTPDRYERQSFDDSPMGPSVDWARSGDPPLGCSDTCHLFISCCQALGSGLSVLRRFLSRQQPVLPQQSSPMHGSCASAALLSSAVRCRACLALASALNTSKWESLLWLQA